jgi:hypothetical protein
MLMSMPLCAIVTVPVQFRQSLPPMRSIHSASCRFSSCQGCSSS